MEKKASDHVQYLSLFTRLFDPTFEMFLNVVILKAYEGDFEENQGLWRL